MRRSSFSANIVILIEESLSVTDTEWLCSSCILKLFVEAAERYWG